MPEYGGNSRQAQQLRWQGYMFGVGVQLITSYGANGGAPSGMPSYSTPNGGIRPVTQPALPQTITTLDEHGLVYSRGDLGKKPKPRSYDKPIGKRVKFPSRKKAYEASRRAGKGEPILHGDGDHGPHFHPNDGNGRPLNHDHYYFPRSQF